MDDRFNFVLYRLNIINEEIILEDIDFYKPIDSDDDLKKVLQNAASPRYDRIQETTVSEYSWCIRNFADYGKHGNMVSIMLARSLLKKRRRYC